MRGFGKRVQGAAGPDMVGIPSDGETDHLEHLVEHIQDAVVEFRLVDGEPIVRGVNPAFTSVFGYDPDDLVGESLNEYLVPAWLADEATELDERTGSGEVNYRRVRRQTAEGLREFLYRGIPYEDESRLGGFAVYTDLTDGLRKERQLDVLNRILRHNLRNKVTVIEGGIEAVMADEGIDSTLAESTRDAATALHRLADEATDIQRTLGENVPADVDVDCVRLVETVVDETRDRYPNTTVETTLPPTLRVAATERLRFAIDALVENAAIHNPSDSPFVRIRAETVLDGDWADIVVDDDGPVIPTAERDVITGERDITPTTHGTGLGLWLVKWTVERYGGRLSFDENDLGGNRVRLRLRRADDTCDNSD